MVQLCSEWLSSHLPHMACLLRVAPFQSYQTLGIYILISCLGDYKASRSMRSYAMGFGRICGGDFKVEWHWWNGIEEDQPGDNVDKGSEETGHQLRAPAIVLKDHD